MAGRDNVGAGVGPGSAAPLQSGPTQPSKSDIGHSRDNYNSAPGQRGPGGPSDRPLQSNGVGGPGPGRGPVNGHAGPDQAGYGRSARVSRRDAQQLDPGHPGTVGGSVPGGPGDRGQPGGGGYSSRGSPASGRRPGGRGGPGPGGASRSYSPSGYHPQDPSYPDHEFDRMDRGMDRPMDRGMDRTGPHARSRSASRGFPTRTTGGGPGYHSLDRDRDGYGGDRDFMPIDRPRDRDRSLDRPLDRAGGPPGGMDYGPPYSGSFGRRDRSLDRSRVDPMSDLDDGAYRDRDPHRTRLSPNPISLQRDAYMQELQSTNADLQRDLANLKKELELTNQKLGSSMHSIKTFWSPELKKERALRKEESAKYALMNDQLKLLNSENQVMFRDCSPCC